VVDLRSFIIWCVQMAPPRSTRSSSTKENDPMSSGFADTNIGVGECGDSRLATIDYRVALAPKNLEELTLITLPHAKNSMCLCTLQHT
jgi:hypothetical protein